MTLHYPYQPDCIHAEQARGSDDTLCGMVANQTEDQADAIAVRHKRRRRVSCGDCVAIIKASRSYTVAAVVVEARSHPSSE